MFKAVVDLSSSASILKYDRECSSGQNVILEFYFYTSNRKKAELIGHSDSTVTPVIIIENIFCIEYIHNGYIYVNIPILHVEPADPFNV